MYVYILGGSDDTIHPERMVFKNPLEAFLKDPLRAAILLCSESHGF